MSKLPTQRRVNEAKSLSTDLEGQGTFPGLTVQRRKVINAAGEIATTRPELVAFQHAILCQVGLPRARVAERTFERTSGSASILVEAGKLWDARSATWIEEALPYGSKPRLALVHIISEAVRTRSRSVDVGRSLYDFMKTLGIDTNGRSYASFRQQLSALSACRITLGFGAETIDSKPIERFRAWTDEGGEADGRLSPGAVVLSPTFYESLIDHAVPLDPRAIVALQKSPLALDLYTWLSHRLHRVSRVTGERVSWQALQQQFGQEYDRGRDFRRRMMESLRDVQAVYPTARVEEVAGALVLLPSPPPVRKTLVALPAG
ncbi:replication protein RepA (plasmid) [Lichenicola cladoniae]|uniref:Replication protein RepA n=1 Tax=Lichenicola cladoniae TaxID=1484109 RepID=A0A6M8I0U2_9PROT|nr:replication protein RepA [Lichenicola cladoniae]NPD70125.1 replication protein RepA [Acetobacteraceae bacterium]QKE93875.1 replication protein RepA [Lichenicola cladoniae]